MTIRSRRRTIAIVTLFSLASLIFVGGLTALLLWRDRVRAGDPIAAELRGDTLALVDYLPHEDGPQQRTTLVELATGKRLERAIADDAPTGYFQPPEQYCTSTRELGERSPLIVPPYYGQIGATHHAEVPPGKVMLAPHTGALGFLADRPGGDPILLDRDVIYIHMYSFDPSVPHGHPESWLTRVGPDGKPRWSRKLAGGCQLAVLRGETLVIAMKSGAHRAIALDVATGEPRWQFDH